MPITTEKKVLLGSFVFVFLTFSVAAVLFEQHVAQKYLVSDQPVGYTSMYRGSSDGRMKAIVKGSIYETGSNMTVFGACYDGNSYLLPQADAKFTAWYPNGSIMIGPNATMDKIYDDFQGNHPNGTGRWKIHVTMESTLGTYLTELRCEYNGQWATDLGEWQNPEWVKKIGDLYILTSGIAGSVNNLSIDVANLSSEINQFRSDTNTNFSSVLDAINNIMFNTTISESDKTQKLLEIYNSVKDADGWSWVVDLMNPTYVAGSGINNWVAVDMAGPRSVSAVSSDGSFQFWDGISWTHKDFPGVEWRGVGVFDVGYPFSVLVGEYAGQAVYSVNGGNATVFSENGSTVLYDVKIVKQPNVPGDATYVYVVSDKGLFLTTNFGGSWTLLDQFTGNVTLSPRMSKIVANNDVGATTGKRFAIVNDVGDILYYNGTGIKKYNSTYKFVDISLVHDGLGYVVGLSGNLSKVWIFEYVNGSIGLTEVYGWHAPYQIVLNFDNTTSYVLQNTSAAFPTGIAAVSMDDVWVATVDPSVFYHFDGFKWQYESYIFSSGLPIAIYLNVGNGSYSFMHDISMSDEYNGYVVGDSGLIIKRYSHVDQRFDDIMNRLSNFSGNLTGNLSVNNAEVLQAIYNMNISLQSSITYGNQYVETVIFPLLNSTYAGIQQILIDIGWLKVTANQTLQITNQTLQIVNATDQKVDVLINRSNRPRVWTTQ